MMIGKSNSIWFVAALALAGNGVLAAVLLAATEGENRLPFVLLGALASLALWGQALGITVQLCRAGRAERLDSFLFPQFFVWIIVTVLLGSLAWPLDCLRPGVVRFATLGGLVLCGVNFTLCAAACKTLARRHPEM